MEEQKYAMGLKDEISFPNYGIIPTYKTPFSFPLVGTMLNWCAVALKT